MNYRGGIHLAWIFKYGWKIANCGQAVHLLRCNYSMQEKVCRKRAEFWYRATYMEDSQWNH